MKLGRSVAAQWDTIYQAWKQKHPNATKESRKQNARDCFKKAAHGDFWSAMLHAKRIEEIGCKPAIYKCPLCKKNHISRRKAWDRWWERGEYATDKFWETPSIDTKQARVLAEQKVLL